MAKAMGDFEALALDFEALALDFEALALTSFGDVYFMNGNVIFESKIFTAKCS
jgi:hypothetical protein